MRCTNEPLLKICLSLYLGIDGSVCLPAVDWRGSIAICWGIVGKGQSGEDSEGNEKDLEREKRPNSWSTQRLDWRFTFEMMFLIWITFHSLVQHTESHFTCMLAIILKFVLAENVKSSKARCGYCWSTDWTALANIGNTYLLYPTTSCHSVS